MSMLVMPCLRAAQNRGDKIETEDGGGLNAIRIKSGRHTHIVVADNGPLQCFISVDNSLHLVERGLLKDGAK